MHDGKSGPVMWAMHVFLIQYARSILWLLPLSFGAVFCLFLFFKVMYLHRHHSLNFTTVTHTHVWRNEDMITLLQTRSLSSSLFNFGLSAENTLLSALTAENTCDQGRSLSKQIPRQVSKAHFTYVCPEPVISPKLVHVSKSVAEVVGVDLSDVNSAAFTSAFSGNTLLPGLDSGYATVYGCHSHGQWLGQLGDGRAISLGEVVSPLTQQRLELQLKGSGKTPYSRGFDGRAVLRSCRKGKSS